MTGSIKDTAPILKFRQKSIEQPFLNPLPMCCAGAPSFKFLFASIQARLKGQRAGDLQVSGLNQFPISS